MGIVYARIDDRLIHGQVATSWNAEVKPSRMMVIDDSASGNDIQKQALKMATPSGVNLSVLSVEKAIANIKNGNYEQQKVMIVVRTPKPLAKLAEAGISLDVPGTVGTLKRNDENCIKITNYVVINQEDKKDFLYLAEKGLHFYAQPVPNTAKVDILNYLKD